MEQAILGKDGYALNDGEIIVHNYEPPRVSWRVFYL